MKGLLLILSVLCISKIEANTYYFSTSFGDDLRSADEAQNPKTPWRSLVKLKYIINNLKSGDSILFQRGDTFAGSVSIAASGAINSPIVFSAYGTGANPIITAKSSVPGWKIPSNWTNEGANLWHMNIDFTSNMGRNYPHRIWLSGIEGAKAQYSTTLSTNTNWFYDPINSLFWVYSVANPSSLFTNIEYPGGSVSNNSSCFWVNGGSYIDIKNLDLRGGLDATVILAGGKGITIEACNIGADAGFDGISGGNMNNIVIKGNIFDTGDRIVDKWYAPDKGLEDGILLAGECNNWQVYSNTFRDWGHACIYLINAAVNVQASNNKFYSNFFFAPDVDYCRAFAADVMEGNSLSTGNEFYYNYVENMNAPVQINCPDLRFHHNVINKVSNANHGGVAGDGATGYGIVIAGYGNMAPHDMYIYNNVIANTDEPGFYYNRNTISDNQAHNNYVTNNIFFNCGKNSTNSSGKQNYAVYINNAVPLGNLIFQSNLLYNSASIFLINNGHYSNNVYSRTNDRTVDQYNSDNGLAGDIISDNIEGDPLFMDAESGDFALQPNSPGLGKGVVIQNTPNKGLSVDSDWPSSVIETPYTSAWDIGPFVNEPLALLPVRFSEIKATKKAEGIFIEWKVENESELDKYEIQRSFDGINFLKIGVVNAKENAPLPYNWTDSNLTASSNYCYRIKIIDGFGKGEFSDIANVYIYNKKDDISIYPNPIYNDHISFKCSFLKKGIYTLKIVSYAGQMLFNKSILLPNDLLNESINFNCHLSKGQYELHIIENNKSIAVTNFIKI